ncbi:hypothetical protein [Thiocapsa roseopersicina]|uniref:Uncharacterized protein n=1 Tax=Thiocapsa roseopersicina TaxID=1058 RepID=A0A1H2ZXN2_THIRO|nr:MULTISPECIES: hypothetical protein [Thiocapsa]CRI63863.1 hypothetical protein THIOKS1160030 [Thiocapsa sp. KS1]SDX22250.1 hypothetical protein SAMN05421783_117104 [Thiocapsa roseopersicina]
MNRKALLEEIRRRNHAHLPALLAALARVRAGIRLTRADHEAVIDGIETGSASLALEKPDRAVRALAARILDLCKEIDSAEEQLMRVSRLG